MMNKSSLFLALIIAPAVVIAVSFNKLDSAGYYLPSSGVASTTQFAIGPEFSGGTACGASAFPNGQSSTSGNYGPSNGPGYLYAAINQLAFGANPSAGSAYGGPGGACGVCYKLTPISSSGTVLTANALTFRIVDECPAAPALSGGSHCDTCDITAKNDFGHTWHFDIAADGMSLSQYNQFFNGVDDGYNWKSVNFQNVACGSANAAPHLKSWGCGSGCSNKDGATVCQGVSGGAY